MFNLANIKNYSVNLGAVISTILIGLKIVYLLLIDRSFKVFF